ncbi:MAG: phosphoglucosamine mutase, partial [Geminicoccaceae bacterium]
LLALIAQSWLADGRLRGAGVVATLMSNFGLEGFLKGLGLDLHRTRVGDRYVVERMREGGFNVGGEQSGHIVLSDFATTGDGLLAALQVLAVLCRSQRPMSEIGRSFAPLPQQLRNVRVASAIDLQGPGLATVLAANEARLAGRGRLVVRPSGTEPLIRVMVEADDEALLEDVISTVADAIERVAVQA